MMIILITIKTSTAQRRALLADLLCVSSRLRFCQASRVNVMRLETAGLVSPPSSALAGLAIGSRLCNHLKL